MEKVKSRYGTLRIHFLAGKTRMSVSVDSENFSERSAKEAMAAEIVKEFAFRRARQMVGKRYAIEEVLREYRNRSETLELW